MKYFNGTLRLWRPFQDSHPAVCASSPSALHTSPLGCAFSSGWLGGRENGYVHTTSSDRAAQSVPRYSRQTLNSLKTFHLWTTCFPEFCSLLNWQGWVYILGILFTVATTSIRCICPGNVYWIFLKNNKNSWNVKGKTKEETNSNENFWSSSFIAQKRKSVIWEEKESSTSQLTNMTVMTRETNCM